MMNENNEVFSMEDEPVATAIQSKYPFYYIFFRGIRKYMG